MAYLILWSHGLFRHLKKKVSLYLVNNFIYFSFWLCQVVLLGGLFSSCRERGLLCGFGTRASYLRGFSCCKAQALRLRGLQQLAALQLSRCSSWALELRLRSCGAQAQLLCGMWDLPNPGTGTVSLALAEGFFTTDPPGKPYLGRILDIFLFFIRPLVSPCLFTLLSLTCSGTVISTLNATASKMYLS